MCQLQHIYSRWRRWRYRSPRCPPPDLSRGERVNGGTILGWVVHEGMKILAPAEGFENHIYLIRGHKVMLSTDLAQLYEVPAKVLVQAVKRNVERFPADFMLQISLGEVRSSRSQSRAPDMAHSSVEK